MKIAVVGATGLVGRVMLKILEERNIIPEKIFPVASKLSVGKIVLFNGKKYPVTGLQNVFTKKPDIALFSAGGVISKEWAAKFADNGCFVIDNSSAWRMFENVPLVVPEINAHVIKDDTKIIANPNCSTIQMVLALAPLHRKYNIKRIVVSTYQSVTGSGQKAVRQLENERKNIAGEKIYPHSIDLNLLPHAGEFTADGYTTEEVKLVNETKKILEVPLLNITATAVRVPVFGGHSEAVNVEFKDDFEIAEIRNILSNSRGITVLDDPLGAVYPMPKYSEGKDDVFVGRIRRDLSNPKTLNLWIVSDNLRKGAATNAVQIAEYLIANNFVK